MEIRHIASNFGELNYGLSWSAGAVHGHDAAGVVVRAASDGSVPKARRSGNGSPRVGGAVAASLGTVPEGVDLADAAALGIAGVTPLRVLRKRSLRRATF
ncbi:hypothetical protein STENM327S_00294 [Streptomyces tendae]